MINLCFVANVLRIEDIVIVLFLSEIGIHFLFYSVDFDLTSVDESDHRYYSVTEQHRN